VWTRTYIISVVEAGAAPGADAAEKIDDLALVSTFTRCRQSLSYWSREQLATPRPRQRFHNHFLHTLPAINRIIIPRATSSAVQHLQLVTVIVILSSQIIRWYIEFIFRHITR